MIAAEQELLVRFEFLDFGLGPVDSVALHVLEFRLRPDVEDVVKRLSGHGIKLLCQHRTAALDSATFWMLMRVSHGDMVFAMLFDHAVDNLVVGRPQCGEHGAVLVEEHLNDGREAGVFLNVSDLRELVIVKFASILIEVPSEQ